MKQQGQFGVYIHWPFCLAKCPYCDFNSHVREGIDHDLWRDAYLRSIDHYASLVPARQVESIYFGGGTPSLMVPETVEAIIDRIQQKWQVSNDIEITLEANPTSVEAEKFRAFREAGINRVSLGVQALNNSDLKFLGRQHNVKEALKAIDIARENFYRYSFDLIYARPKQTLKDWQEELERAVTYTNGHLSLYQLTIERGTQFYQDYAQKKFVVPGEELAADFYNLTQDVLEAHNLPAYEVSNHARAGDESRHNLIYWHYGDYVGIGPGAHGRLTMEDNKFATREHRSPEIWLERVAEQGSGVHPFEGVPPEDRFVEALMMGLRLRDGVSLLALEREAGQNWQDFIDEDHVNQAAKEGWLVHQDDCLRLTHEGLLRLNAMVPYLLRERRAQPAVVAA
ncbi:MAG: coproporphyrinogen III oxidase [Micavibrio sp.]|nr:MAG: coproporphyrinogen III oxidase [Micavibrio sp.]